MRLDKCALLCAILALSILEPITARRSYGGGKGGGHTYPKSGGLSGGGHTGGGHSGGGHSGGGHNYPPSGGLSGGGGHGYPGSGGLSGGGHGSPSSGGTHTYPNSGGTHGYPGSGGLSGGGSANTHHPNNHGYPAGKGLQGNTGSNVHHHYHYSPPQQISYTPVHGGAPVHYPVYRGTPPNYVYQYKDSGSKYGTLLTGLALLNLGALGATAYAASHSHSGSNYKAQPGEVCKFGLKKDNGDYEETKIECQLISSFILQAEANAHNATNNHNTTTTTTTVTNVTMVNTTNPVVTVDAPINQTAVGNPTYEMLPNGTLVPVNVTHTNATVIVTSDASAPNNAVSSVMVTTTVTNTTTNAVDVKGKDVQVTPGMQCFVIRVTPSTTMRKHVPCGLLQTYAEKSIKPNSAVRNAPAFTVLAVILAAFVIY